MAQQVNGHVILAQNQYDTYEHWRNFALTHGVNFDGWYGNQCWDLPALLWYQYGLNLVTKPGGNGVAYQCWTVSRYINGRPPFTSIDGVSNIKRGDCLVFGSSSIAGTGHICFADSDYSGRYWDARYGCWRLNCLGQNQGQGVGWGVPSNVVGLNLAGFLGIFRNTKWASAPPTPTPTPGKSTRINKYPWVLYTDKLRKTRSIVL